MINRDQTFWESDILCVLGLVTRGNFYRQLGGNRLQRMLHDHFGSTGVIFSNGVSYDLQEKFVNIQV